MSLQDEGLDSYEQDIYGELNMVDFDEKMYPEGEVKEAIQKLNNDIINDWEFCKKANCEPHIHPRRVLEVMKKRFGEKLCVKEILNEKPTEKEK